MVDNLENDRNNKFSMHFSIGKRECYCNLTLCNINEDVVRIDGERVRYCNLTLCNINKRLNWNNKVEEYDCNLTLCNINLKELKENSLLSSIVILHCVI